jgi:hypothetical protein
MRLPSPQGSETFTRPQEDTPMNKLSMPLQSALWWLLPLVVLAGLFGWETDWGRAVETRPEPAEAVEPKPVVTALLPEFEIPGGVATRTETIERTLFNPTRRPAPQMAQEGGASQMKRGQFALTGTLLIEGKNTAFLREVAGNKARRVQAGETINGMRVADVKADRVMLTLGDESEELVLKVATNPRPTPAPVVAAAQPAPVAGVPAAPVAPVQANRNAAAAGVAPAPGAQTAVERRRAARAAAAAAAAAGGNPPPQPGANPWDQINQSYQQRAAGRQNPK